MTCLAKCALMRNALLTASTRCPMHTVALAILLLTITKSVLHVPMTYCMACWCLLQAAGAGQLAAVPSLQSAPLGLTQPANLDPPGSVLHPRDPGLAASASSNQQQIKELCSVVEGKDRCLRTAEAFIEAHLLQLQQQEWSMNIHKGQRDCARKEVRRLRSELQPLQQEHDMAHHRHDAAVRKRSQCLCVV